MSADFQVARRMLSLVVVLDYPAAETHLSSVKGALATHVGAEIQEQHFDRGWRALVLTFFLTFRSLTFKRLIFCSCVNA
jgi:hypothetical protein